MDLSEFQPAFQRPHYLSTSSSWVEHIPFAFLLADLLRPRTFVELGTNMGDSYCAFCQVLATLPEKVPPSQCTAIDTWQGDPHTGLYDESVLTILRRYHDPLYGTFSRLLQSTFDAAQGQFADGSIDLLHIDGLHTYEAVSHDFETWLPKVSSRGVVIFHDTQVTKGDFGVHRFWKEISPRHPNFEFHHGYGLGILAVGADIAPRVAAFLQWTNSQPQIARDFFSALGGRLLLSLTATRINGLLHREAKGSGAENNLAPKAEQWMDSGDIRGRAAGLEYETRRRFRRFFPRVHHWLRR